jgi:GWxTD domain-containing protein
MERVLIESAVRAALLALATYSLLRLLRIRNAAAQHAAWTTVVVAMLVLPAWALWGPRAYLGIGPAPAARSSAPADWAQTSTSAVEAPSPATASIGVTAVPPPPPPIRRLPWSAVFWGAYGLGVVLLLGRLTLGTVRAWRLIRRATRSPGTPWRRSSERGAYLTSDACVAPVAVGWLRPVVILPDRWPAWSASQLDMVLSHEHEHVRRRDPLVQWLALLNRALFWFHPLAWWLERRLALLAEEACDAAVLSRGHRPTDYSEYLLCLARSVAGAGTRVHVVGNAMPGTFLSRRIRRMLTAAPELPTSARRRRWALIVCGLMAILVAALTVGPRPAHARAMESARPQTASSTGTRLQEFWFDDDEWHLEVASIMRSDELDAYRRLQTSAERDAFIADFWRRRDPSRGSEANEFRAEFERRLAYAKEHLADTESAATYGYDTDRGRWYVQFGAPTEIVSRPFEAEEWRYASLPGLGSNVVVQFDPKGIFGCSYRGGRYRIASPEPLKRFDGASTKPGSRHPFALTYPARFVHVSFPIDPDAAGIRWRLRAAGEAGGAAPDPDDTLPAEYWIQSFRSAQRFVQGDINMRARSVVGEPLLKHVASLRFFEPGGIACTEQLPAGTYTLSIETRFEKGEDRTETMTFTVE